jgi:4-hydroxy-2-oxoheptanedioate aldolase
VLDFGAAGILFPRAESRRDAAAAGAAMRYAGRRGVSPLARSAGWGATADGWKEAADGAVACIIQIERRSALEAVEEIAGLDDVDALLVGPADLSNDLGCPLDLNGGPLAEAAMRVARAARASEKGAGIHLPDATMAGQWADAGFNLLSASFESQVLASGSKRVATQLRHGTAG